MYVLHLTDRAHCRSNACLMRLLSHRNGVEAVQDFGRKHVDSNVLTKGMTMSNQDRNQERNQDPQQEERQHQQGQKGQKGHKEQEDRKQQPGRRPQQGEHEQQAPGQRRDQNR